MDYFAGPINFCDPPNAFCAAIDIGLTFTRLSIIFGLLYLAYIIVLRIIRKRTNTDYTKRGKVLNIYKSIAAVLLAFFIVFAAYNLFVKSIEYRDIKSRQQARISQQREKDIAFLKSKEGTFYVPHTKVSRMSNSDSSVVLKTTINGMEVAFEQGVTLKRPIGTNHEFLANSKGWNALYYPKEDNKHSLESYAVISFNNFYIMIRPGVEEHKDIDKEIALELINNSRVSKTHEFSNAYLIQDEQSEFITNNTKTVNCILNCSD